MVDVGGGDAELVLERQRDPGAGVVFEHRYTDEHAGVEDHVGQPVFGPDKAVVQMHLSHQVWVVLVEPAAVVEVHQRRAGGVVHHIAVGVVAA